MSVRKLLPLAVLACSLAAPAAARADFGFAPGSPTVTALEPDGTLDTRAGSHPGSLTVSFELKQGPDGHTEGGEMRSVVADLPPGLVGNPKSMPRCSAEQFEGTSPGCPGATQVGLVQANVTGLGEVINPLYNIEPPPGVAAEFGFSLFNFVPLQFSSVRSEDGYGVSVVAPNLPLEVTRVTETIWGTPSDPSHDPDRVCADGGAAHIFGCPAVVPHQPYLTLPTSCGPLETTIKADTKQNPGVYVSRTVPLLDAGGQPADLKGCESVPFEPKISAVPSSRLAENPSGLDFELKLPNKGLLDSNALSESVPERVEVALPEGVTANPALAEGIGVCGEAQYRAEQIDTKPGQGCPEAAKIGSIVGHSPLIEEPVEGSLFLAKPYENPSGSLIALYIVARAPERGVLIKQAGRVDPDPRTGRLVTTFEGLPPLPYSDFRLHFREGGRAPLITPPACGRYETTARLTPYSTPDRPYTATGAFQIEAGVSGGACPPGGTPPFRPGFEAGTLSNSAGKYSPFEMRLTRADGDQDLTRLSTTLPPGVLASLVGVGRCSDAQIAQAQSRTGPHGGAEELANPSCPAGSAIGHTDTGAGVGGTLIYVPGTLYLAGPYHGAPLSVVAIVPGVAGPFDVGTIVVRLALRFNPRSGEAEADGASSDPIPHILKGIPLKVRDIRVHVDRPNWIFNPTSCAASSTKARLWGGGADVFSALDDSPIALAARFQAADCANLAFKPGLSLSLKGSSAKRGGHPALTGVYKPRKGDANLKGLVLRLPRSAFLDQAHIRTICTRVQYAANGGDGGGCPRGAIYGRAKAYTPLLEDPLEGPVYLRSSNHNLPDFVAALHGLVDIEAVARIDSKKGGIRATFTNLPDAPITKVVVRMQGGEKGLIVNSTDICAGEHRADARFEGHNGRRHKIAPALRAQCGKKSTQEINRRHHQSGRNR